MPAESEEIGMARSIEQSPWEAYEALIESIMKNADHDFWDSGSDIEAVAYVRHLEGEVERLRAELRTTVAEQPEEIPQQVKQRHGYRITTAWVSQAGETPWLLNAYDEATEDAWGGPPDFFTEAVTKARGQGDEVRIVHLTISYEAVAERFAAGMTEAEVSGSSGGER